MLPVTVQTLPPPKRNYHTVKYPKPKDFKPVERFPTDYPDIVRAGNRRCQAWSKRNGRQCTNLPIIGVATCRHHGGKSLKGMAVPGYQTGRWSKYLPKGLSEKYEQALHDVDLFNLKPDIALLDARAAQLIEKLDTNEGNWDQVKRSFADLVAAMRQGDSDSVKANLSDLQTAINAHDTEAMVWDEIPRVLEQRRKTIDTERRRYLDTMKVMAIGEVIQLLHAISSEMAEVVKLNVEEKQARAIITESQRRLQKYLTASD